MKIVTIYEAEPNYGNRLQNYATYKTLNTFGFSPETYMFEKSKVDLKFYIKFILQRLFAYKLTGDSFFWKYTALKYINFNKFNKKYIPTKKISQIEEINTEKEDFFVVGSDQVWNPEWYYNLRKDMYLLTFAKPEQKICFAPSFGISQLPDKWKDFFKEHLETFPNISVRESAGAEIVEQLIGRKADVIIDPTLMLDEAQWSIIARKPKNVDFSKPYILTYFLGERSERINSDLEKYADENNMKVYNLLDKKQPEIFVSGPAEFLYLIKHSSLVMTDSFHACVFSFIFNKPFLVYSREGKEDYMFSRIDFLLETLDLKRKFVDSGLENQVFECDYSQSNTTLTHERKKAINFLKNSMNLK